MDLFPYSNAIHIKPSTSAIVTDCQLRPVGKARREAQLDGPEVLKPPTIHHVHKLNLVDVSDIFYYFLLGEGQGGVRGAGRGGGAVFIENPTREGGFSRTGGAEGPGGCLRRIGFFVWGGGGGG